MPKLVWTLTGDEIPLIPCNNELYEYFVSQLKLNKVNKYVAPWIDYSELMFNLNESYSVINLLLKNKIHCNTLDEVEPNWLDQKFLNRLHRNWVKLNQIHPNIAELLEKFQEGASRHWHRFNKLIHDMEESFDEFQLVNDIKSFENIFDRDLTMIGIAGLRIDYSNLGRSTLNKWTLYDNGHEFDTNNFKEIYSELILSLARPRTHSIPLEYNNDQLLGDKIGLANFDRLEDNLLNYRQLVYKNFRLESNFIELH